MNKKYLFSGAAAVCMALMFSCAGTDNHDEAAATETTTEPAAMTHEEMVARGDYLVNTVGGCADCHAPKKMTERGPEPDMDLYLSGHPADSPMPEAAPDASAKGWVLMTPDLTAFVGPWGTSFSANLTPDTLTGIGTWTEEIFLRAFQEGKFHGLPAGRDLLPPMPWQVFAHMTHEDALSIFAYLKTLKPVSNAVPAPLPPAGS